MSRTSRSKHKFACRDTSAVRLNLAPEGVVPSVERSRLSLRRTSILSYLFFNKVVGADNHHLTGETALGSLVVGSIPALSTPVSLKFLPRWQLAAIAVAFAMLQHSRASAPQPPKCGSCGWGQQTAPINLRRLMETSTAIRTQPAAHMHVPPTHCAVFFAKSLDLDQYPSFALRASPGPSLKRSSSLAIPFPIPVLVYPPSEIV